MAIRSTMESGINMECRKCGIPEEIAGRPFAWMVERVFIEGERTKDEYICNKCYTETMEGDQQVATREDKDYKQEQLEEIYGEQHDDTI